jgi:futalosine hydrolase
MAGPARILVIVAVDGERAALGAACTAGGAVEVVVAGIGRTNAAAATAEAIAAARAAGWPFTAVVSAGIAGALPGSGLAIGDVVVADACAYAEEGIALPEGFRDMRALRFALGDFEGNRVPVDAALAARLAPLGRTGTIATVATCSGTDAAAAEVVARTGAIAEAMEGAAVVHAARRAGLPAIEVRAISNTTGDRPRQRWDLPAAFASLARVGASLAP